MINRNKEVDEIVMNTYKKYMDSKQERSWPMGENGQCPTCNNKNYLIWHGCQNRCIECILKDYENE